MQRIVKRSHGLVLALAVVAAGLSGCSQKAPDWEFTDAGGELRSLSDYRGGVVVLGFTNTWCDPCQEAAREMQALQERYAEQGVRIVYVSSWERGDPLNYMEDHGYDFGLITNGTRIARRYKVDRLPTFCVVGVDGKIVYRHEGFDSDTPHKIARAISRHVSTQQRTAMHTNPAEG